MLLAIVLLWTDLLNPATSTVYNVYRAPGICSANSAFVKLTQNTIPTTTYQDNPPSGTYCYQVTAVINGIEGPPSNQLTVVTKPAAPTDLRLNAAP